jgi:hypothetical protein
MHRMFAAALLAATMVGGAALVPSGASAATVPGPSAIPSADVVRNVDPEVAGIEQVGQRHCYHHPCYRKYSHYRRYPHYRTYGYYRPHYRHYSYYPHYYDDYDDDHYPHYYHRPYYPHYYHRPGFSIVIGGGHFGGHWGDDD